MGMEIPQRSYFRLMGSTPSLHSLMEEKDELIEVWFNNLRLQSEAIYSITGFGDGSHIRYF